MPIINAGRAVTDHGDTPPPMEDFLGRNHGRSVTLPPDADLNTLEPRLSGLTDIEVGFPAFTDGRGFSIGKQLRRMGFEGRLTATGPIIPDQYVYALQCGFDQIKIDEETFSRFGEADFKTALDAFALTYQPGYAHPLGPATNIFKARAALRKKKPDDSVLDPNPDLYSGLSGQDSLRRAITQDFKGEIVLASSLGVDSAVLLHMVSEIDPGLPILFLETGQHFKETLAYRDQLVARLGLTHFRSIPPSPKEVADIDPDGTLNQRDRDLCCNLRKVRPLDREIEPFKARITGRKRYQTPQRATMPILETGGRQIKVNPLAFWSAKDVTAYIRAHDLPPHPLLALGFLSIGCEPCTTRVTDGEDPRAGRWRNSDKTECGIHMIDGKWVSVAPEVQTHEVF
ncbi:phosphoadenylyl-sulfate reductase [Robiginitomaculum antarcticum]|uniref:phosphoadenylyl-sulfate reductase n=1 Tax=Robiginitomaculum antarcticum TaxID=437507 RepID=UPI000366C56B|nr:phosphoadenylyl-sulfate reductase [Robiginitomaculum antarcticum]